MRGSGFMRRTNEDTSQPSMCENAGIESLNAMKLVPAFETLRGDAVHEAVLARGLKVTGATAYLVDETGGDGSLEANSTYTDWQWVLVRTAGGDWEHATHGYA